MITKTIGLDDAPLRIGRPRIKLTDRITIIEPQLAS
jgi:hypothetical protein